MNLPILLIFFSFLQFVYGLDDNERASFLIKHVKQCIQNSELEISKIQSNEILEIYGMSSPKVRHLLNNLCALDNTSYLEIGVWKGSTFISALYNNEKSIASAIAIDDFSICQSDSKLKRITKWCLKHIPISDFQSRFGDPKEVFYSNVSNFLKNISVNFYEADCFAIDKAAVFKKPVNIYFYDGNHSELSQEKAFTYFNSIFDNVFIAIIDDWNWEGVRNGTLSAFRQLGYKILFEKEFFTKEVNKLSWWNGIYIAVVQK